MSDSLNKLKAVLNDRAVNTWAKVIGLEGHIAGGFKDISSEKIH